MTRPDFRVLRGNPTEAETAALALALARLAEPHEHVGQRPAWLRAARVEGRGDPPIVSAADLRSRRGA